MNSGLLSPLHLSSRDNAASVARLAPQAAALKLYLNDTFTSLRLDSVADWMPHFQHWPKSAPLCVHAEGRWVSHNPVTRSPGHPATLSPGHRSTAAAILLASLEDRPLHICHVARREEILVIRAAKEKGLPITCEVSSALGSTSP